MLDVQGFENLGSTCYINSMVQCLVALPELRAAFGVPAASEGQNTPSGPVSEGQNTPSGPVSWLAGAPNADTPCGPVSRAFGSLMQELLTSGGKFVQPIG